MLDKTALRNFIDEVQETLLVEYTVSRLPWEMNQSRIRKIFSWPSIQESLQLHLATKMFHFFTHLKTISVISEEKRNNVLTKVRGIINIKNKKQWRQKRGIPQSVSNVFENLPLFETHSLRPLRYNVNSSRPL